ncbi:MAG: YCF48-related protein [Gammaproteobacteria bacterium]|nr:YCF48-related protein [Gammaproteobacteria bacterium]
MGFRGVVPRLITVLAVVGLYACEAPLVLDHVKQQRSKITQRSDLFQAAAGNSNAIVVVGNGGVLITSRDQGETWQRRVLENQPFMLDLTVCPDGQFVALAFENQLHIGDATAETWRAVAIDSAEVPQAVACDPRGRVWVVGSFSSILRSDDLGETWTSTSMDEDLHFTTVQFVDQDNAFLTGEFGVVVRTTDGGETWENLPPLPDEFYPQDAYFRDVRTGWIVGLNGMIWTTVDGGQSWSRESTGTTAPLYGITANGAGLFTVGGFGTVLTSGPTGDWTRVDHGKPIRFYLRGVLPLDDHRLLAVGGAGALFVIES